MNLKYGNGSKTSHNKGLPKAGLKFYDCLFVQGSTVIMILSLGTKNPGLGKAMTVSHIA